MPWSSHSEVTCINLAFVYVCHLKDTPQGEKRKYIIEEREVIRDTLQNRVQRSKVPVVAMLVLASHMLFSSSVNALSTAGRGVSLRQAGFTLIPLRLLNVNLLHVFSRSFTAEIALNDG